MSAWNFDIAQAPRGRMVTVETGRHTKTGGAIMSTKYVAPHVILATKCGKVLKSHYAHDEDRWMMLAKGEQPVAWMPWPEYPGAVA